MRGAPWRSGPIRARPRFKAYMNISRAELGAAIDEAHKRGIKVTRASLLGELSRGGGGWGIDNLEHGFWVNTQLDPGKTADTCSADTGAATLAAIDPRQR